jgi:pimeloyl-ACP methyl ester carboxylesterase
VLWDWIERLSLATGMVAAMGLSHRAQRLRAPYMDMVVPVLGDILLYQAEPSRIEDRIKTVVETARYPVVLLGHSLGGIACVSWLIREPREKVKGLITVGSQAPFFYEIGALNALPFPNKLPDYFPPWLNLLDRRDLLAFAVDSLVKPGAVGSGARFTQATLNNKQSFPAAHGSYWANGDTFKAIHGFYQSLSAIK